MTEKARRFAERQARDTAIGLLSDAYRAGFGSLPSQRQPFPANSPSAFAWRWGRALKRQLRKGEVSDAR